MYYYLSTLVLLSHPLFLNSLYHHIHLLLCAPPLLASVCSACCFWYFSVTKIDMTDNHSADLPDSWLCFVIFVSALLLADLFVSCDLSKVLQCNRHFSKCLPLSVPSHPCILLTSSTNCNDPCLSCPPTRPPQAPPPCTPAPVLYHLRSSC